MKKLITILFTLLLFHFTSFAQLNIDWQQSYGSMAPDDACDVAETDGGFLVTGIAESGGGQVACFEYGNGGGWLLKIDYKGELIWQKCFDYAYGLRIVKAIGSPYYYLIGGAMAEPYPDDLNLWIAKIDTLGNIIWDRTLGNTIGILGGDQYGVATADGGVIGTAQIDSQGGDITHNWGGFDGWLIKLDSLGNTEWDQSIGSSQTEFINSVLPTTDGGYLAGLYGTPNGIGGNIDCLVTPGPTGPDAIIYKLDSAGQAEWHQCYGGTGYEGAAFHVEVEDGYLLAAYGSSTDGDMVGSGWHEGWYNPRQPTVDVWLVKIDFLGKILWQKCYGGSKSELPHRIFKTSDGGFVVFANTSSNDGDVSGNLSVGQNTSIWVFKVDSNGVLLWQRCIGGVPYESVAGVIQLSDYKYTVAGEMRASPTGDVNCSNFVPGSGSNYWVFGVSDTTVNIAETSAVAVDIKVYPNPAKSVLNIDFPANYDILHSTIEIINVNGKTSMQSKPIFHSTQLDIKSLTPGLYIVKIQNNDALITRRLVVQ